MRDYILLQNMLELAEQLSNVANKELLIREIEKPMDELHRDKQREIYIDVRCTLSDDDIARIDKMIAL